MLCDGGRSLKSFAEVAFDESVIRKLERGDGSVPVGDVGELRPSGHAVDAMATKHLRDVGKEVGQRFAKTRVCLARKILDAAHIQLGSRIHGKYAPNWHAHRLVADFVCHTIPEAGKKRIIVRREQQPDLLQRRNLELVRPSPNNFAREARHEPIRTHDNWAFGQRPLRALALAHVLQIQSRASGLPDGPRSEIHQFEAMSADFGVELRDTRLTPVAADAR
mmetsp:Transcript_15325/g.41172  ORF Transcript_15325/g.41172 Transcript_15325/m.41172 type:complete len:221 (+) Transcript_15325:56-718(+)